MFANWKERLAEKRAKNRAIEESQHWKHDARLQECLQAMRGSCTVSPMELHEAAIAVVNIALMEPNWTDAARVPADFLSGTVLLLWNEEKFPVLKAPWAAVLENLPQVTAPAGKTFLVSESMDRIVWLDEDGRVRLYSIA